MGWRHSACRARMQFRGVVSRARARQSSGDGGCRAGRALGRLHVTGGESGRYIGVRPGQGEQRRTSARADQEEARLVCQILYRRRSWLVVEMMIIH